MILLKTLNGKVWQETTFAGFVGTLFSAVTQNAVLVGPRSAIGLKAPGGTMAGGVRECRIYVLNQGASNEKWILMADGGDGSLVGSGGPWKPQMTISTDRGLTWSTWTILDVWSSGGGFVQGGASTTVTTRANNGVIRVADGASPSGEYFYLCTLYTTSSPASNQISSQPYLFDVFRNSTFTATGWTYYGAGLSQGAANTFDDRDALAWGSIFDGANWQFYYSATKSEDGTYSIGRTTSAGPGGPFSGRNQITTAVSKDTENASVSLISLFTQYMFVANRLKVDHSRTDANRLALSASLTDFSAATYVDVMPISPAWGSVAMGVASPPILPAGGIATDTITNRTFFAFDADPTDSNHIGRKGYVAPVHMTQALGKFNPVVYAGDFSTPSSPATGWTNYTGQVAAIAGGTLNVVNAPTPNSINVVTGFARQYPLVDCIINVQHTNILMAILSGNKKIQLALDQGSYPQLYYEDAGGSYHSLGSYTGSAITYPGNADTRIRFRRIGPVYHLWMDAGSSGVASSYAGSITDTLSAGAMDFPLQVGFEEGSTTPGTVCKKFEAWDSAIYDVSEAQAWDSTTGLLAEVWVDATAIPATVGLELLQNDGSGYRFRISDGSYLSAFKINVAGVETATLAVGSGTISLLALMQGWIKISISAAGLMSGYFQGEQHFSFTDTTWQTGGKVGICGAMGPVRIYQPSVYKAPTVTVNGLLSGDVVTLRGPGGMPLASVTSIGTSVTLDPATGASYPIPEIEIIRSGTNIGSKGLDVWGGDTWTFSSSIRGLASVTGLQSITM